MSKALLDMGISFPKVGWGHHGAKGLLQSQGCLGSCWFVGCLLQEDWPKHWC